MNTLALLFIVLAWPVLLTGGVIVFLAVLWLADLLTAFRRWIMSDMDWPDHNS